MIAAARGTELLISGAGPYGLDAAAPRVATDAAVRIR